MKLPSLFARPSPFARPSLFAHPAKPGAATLLRATLDLFTLKTGRDTWLTLDGPQVAMSPTPTTPVLLAVPQSAPQLSILIAPDARAFCVEGDGLTAPAISARLRRTPGGRAELRHPIAAARCLGIVTGAPVGNPNRVLFDRTGDRVLDRFLLHPADPADLAPEATLLLDELSLALHPPISAATLLALLQTAKLRPALAEPLIRLLPPDELDTLARRLLASPPDLALLRGAIPLDPWLNATLPALITWLAGSRPQTRIAASPASEDHVAILQTGDLRPQAGLALLANARASTARVSGRRGRSNSTLVSPMARRSRRSSSGWA